MCSILGFECEQVDRMRDSVNEMMERADKVAEVVELIDTMSRTEQERAMYMFLFGKQWQAKSQQTSSSSRPMFFRGEGDSFNDAIQKVINAIKRKMDDLRDQQEE